MKRELRIQHRGAWLVALCLAARLGEAGQRCLPAPELVAPTIDLPEPVAVTHYDIALRTELDQNRLHLETTCTVRNQGAQPLEQMDFDLLAEERTYGAKIEVDNVGLTAGSRRMACQFSHGSLEKVGAPEQEGTPEFPKLVQVKLPSPLAVSAECRLVFAYSVTVRDPAKDTDYRLIAQLPSGEKEVCLMDDFSWLPRPFQRTAGDLALGERNFFTKGSKSAWRITVSHPAALESLVLDGRLEGTKKAKGITVSRYASVRSSRPQLLIGPCERVEVPGLSISVVFLLPKGKYSGQEITNSAIFLQRAYEFYRDHFGPLEGKPIHVAVSSAGMGGHGAFLGMFLDSLPAREADSFNETAAHELAHSWCVSSYGRGTKFLRESFATFAARHLAQTEFHRDLFRYEAVRLFCYGILTRPLFKGTGDSADDAYTKGALVVDQLRQEMGDETFFAVLRSFRSRFRDGHASFGDFVAVCNDVSRRDWLPFLTHWCYGQGLPAYHLVGFNSVSSTNGWRTSVTFTNAGQGIVTCPVEMQMAAGPQRERFAVPESESRAFVWLTPSQVTNVVIDPDHIALQGDAEELRAKLLALPDTLISENWPLYWKAVAHGDVGDYRQAEALLSRGLAGFAKVGRDVPSAVVNPYYFSRGVVRLLTGHTNEATEDLRDFLDGILQLESQTPAPAQQVAKDLAYARLLMATTLEGRLEQLRQLLHLITGADVPMDSDLAQWRKWWRAHRADFHPGFGANRLGPSGVRSESGAIPTYR